MLPEEGSESRAVAESRVVDSRVAADSRAAAERLLSEERMVPEVRMSADERVFPEVRMSPEQRRDSSTWVGILEAMEDELQRSSTAALKDQLRGDQHEEHPAPATTFVLPADAGPIPPELVERARQILAAQHEAIERVEVARRTTGRHLAAMRSVPPHRGERSVYLDISG